MSSYLAIYGTSGISHTFADMRGAFKAMIRERQLHHCRQFQAPPTWTYTYRYDYIYAHDASYIFINERTIAITSAQPVRATNDMCVVIYEAAKSHLCTSIFCGVQDSHSYTH